jgi:hypothetical protein
MMAFQPAEIRPPANRQNSSRQVSSSRPRLTFSGKTFQGERFSGRTMRRNYFFASRLAVLVFAMITGSGLLVSQTLPASNAGIPIPEDWSHRHLIFSRPATPDQARHVEQDSRYWQQRHRRELPVVVQATGIADQSISAPPAHRSDSETMTGDWQENMGSGATSGAINSPAKFSFLGTTANCGNAAQPDFVTYNTGLTGSATQASIVAYDNLYSGCTGTVPSTYWAYNSGGQILTSPTYSEDGTQVAFAQTNAGLNGYLVLLKWVASTTQTVGSPGTPTTAASASNYYTGTNCAAPCMFKFQLTNTSGTPADDRTSSVFVDYSGDAAYVGDSHGWLHKFTPVFRGIPGEIRTGGWPAQLNPSSPTSLTDPVHDFVSRNVFVGDAGGFLYRVNSSTGIVTKSGQLDYGVGITQGPIVDGTSGAVYVFSSSDGTTACTGGVACSAVYQLTNAFAAGNTGNKVAVGTSVASAATPNPIYFGAFDNSYITSGNATGNLYVCGNTGLSPTLYRVPITAGTFGPAVSLAALTAAGKTPACSSVTDVANPNTTGGASERLFFGVQNNAHPTVCAGKGCALSFVDMPWQGSTSYQVGQEILVLRAANNTLYINVAIAGGRSAATSPTWPATVGAITGDGTVSWLNQGATLISALASWAANHPYALHARIIDSNGNVQVVSVAGNSGPGPGAPTWSTTAGASTIDGSVAWINAGVLPSTALPSASGTSGFIIDNTVGSGTLTGASQVYFSTLGNQVCTTSGTTGGCAVQASQSALK